MLTTLQWRRGTQTVLAAWVALAHLATSAVVPLHRRRLRATQPGRCQPPAVRSMRHGPARAHHRRFHARPPPAPRRGRGHRGRVVPDERGEVTRRWSRTKDLTTAPSWPGVRICLATTADFWMAIDKARGVVNVAADGHDVWVDRRDVVPPRVRLRAPFDREGGSDSDGSIAAGSCGRHVTGSGAESKPERGYAVEPATRRSISMSTRDCDPCPRRLLDILSVVAAITTLRFADSTHSGVNGLAKYGRRNRQRRATPG